MEIKEPKVEIIAATEVKNDGLQQMLEFIGAGDWESDATSPADMLHEVAGRMCYRSWKPGMNPNVTKVTKGNKPYLANIIDHGHGAVLEHGSATVWFQDVSRIFTHELVRHRAGMAYSQESLRYVRLDELSIYYPEAYKMPFLKRLCQLQGYDESYAEALYDRLAMEVEETIAFLEHKQTTLASLFQMEHLRSFEMKKQITSANRRWAPLGLQTSIIATGNHRAWRHILQMRANEHAEEEIHKVMDMLATQLYQLAPATYGDIIQDRSPATEDGGHRTTTHFKQPKV